MKIFIYLFKQTMVTYAAISTLLLIIIISGRFVSYLADAATGRFASDLVLSLILFKLPSFAALILPIGLFIGILLAYGQLYVDSEMVVIKACGVSKKRLLAYVAGPVSIVMLSVGALTIWLAPLGHHYFLAAWDNPDNFSGVGTLLPGKFQGIGAGNVIYIGALNKNKTEMSDVFLASSQEGGEISMARSVSGTIKAASLNQKELQLKKGEYFLGRLGDLDMTFSSFDTMSYKLLQGSSDAFSADPVDDTESMSTSALWKSNDRSHLIELFWRISFILLVPFSAIIALSMSETSHRRGRYAKLLPAILLFITYLGAMIICKNAVLKGSQSILLLLFPHIIFMVVGLIMYFTFELRSYYSTHFRSLRNEQLK